MEKADRNRWDFS